MTEEQRQQVLRILSGILNDNLNQRLSLALAHGMAAQMSNELTVLIAQEGGSTDKQDSSS